MQVFPHSTVSYAQGPSQQFHVQAYFGNRGSPVWWKSLLKRKRAWGSTGNKILILVRKVQEHHHVILLILPN